MCIIVYKPTGVELPDKALLKECWDTNSHGGGFAIGGDGKVTVHKGYMKFKPMYQALKLLVHKDTMAVIHFRIGTSGKRDKTATHPFPISDSPKDLQILHYTSDVVAFHNGVVRLYGDKDWSDTQEFIATELFPLKDVLRREAMGRVLELATGSKWALLYPDLVVLIGSFHEKDGIYYSNYGYVASNWHRGATGSYIYQGGEVKRWNVDTKAWEEIEPTSTVDDNEEDLCWDEWERKHNINDCLRDSPYWDLSKEDREYCNNLGQCGMCEKCDYCFNNEVSGVLLCGLSEQAAEEAQLKLETLEKEEEEREEKEAEQKAALAKSPEITGRGLMKGSRWKLRRNTRSAMEEESRKTAWGRGQEEEEDLGLYGGYSRYM